MKSMYNDKVLSAIGLAKRANKIVCGFDGISARSRRGEISLLVIASDCSVRTQKDYTDKCAFYNIEHIIYGTKSELGFCAGKDEVAAVGICDGGFAGLVTRNIRGG